MMLRYQYQDHLNRMMDRDYLGGEMREWRTPVDSSDTSTPTYRAHLISFQSENWFHSARTLFVIATWTGLWVSALFFFPF